MSMKLAVLLIAGFGLVFVSSGAFAAVANTDHNLSFTNDGGEICQPCHTPHNAKPIGYLWNHSHRADSAYAKWEGSTLGSASLSCLSCHDGQTSVDDYYGATAATAGKLFGRKALGLDLTNDHPVGVEYPTSSRYAAKGTVYGGPGISVGTSGLPLFTQNGKDQVECATCHTPHTDNYGDFLRISNDGSALCLACHASW